MPAAQRATLPLWTPPELSGVPHTDTDVETATDPDTLEIPDLEATGLTPLGPDPAPTDAVEIERIVPSSGNLGVCGQQFWLGTQRAGQTVTLRIDTTTVHLALDGTHLKTLPSRMTTSHLARLRATGAVPPDLHPPDPPPPSSSAGRWKSTAPSTPPGTSPSPATTSKTPPLGPLLLRLLRRQDGRCPVCGSLLLHADQQPQSPAEWEQWHTALRKAIRHTAITGSGDPTDDNARCLMHTDCARSDVSVARRSPALLTNRTPTGLA